MRDGEITYKLDELHLYLDGRESTLYVYGKADIAFDDDELFVRKITLTMEEDDLELSPRDPLFPLIERTLIDHYAESVWEQIKEEYADDDYLSRADYEYELARDRLAEGE